MPQPQLRADAINGVFKELKRMEDRRGHTTMLDERRLQKALAGLDDSAESEVVRAAIQAQWDRNHEGFDSAAAALLEVTDLSYPESVYVNFAAMGIHVLNVALSRQFSLAAFQASQGNPELLKCILHNTWDVGDLELHEKAVVRLGKLGADDFDELHERLHAAKDLLAMHGATPAEFQHYIQLIYKLIRGFMANCIDAYLDVRLVFETYDDDQQELVLQFDLGLDDETLDEIDTALLSLLSDETQVSPRLNKCIGVLVRDYPKQVGAEAC